MTDWNTLAQKRWEREEIYVFRTPPDNGIRRIVKRSSDLKVNERKYSVILFPSSNLAKKHRLEDEAIAPKRVYDPLASDSLSSSTGDALTSVQREKLALERCAERLYQDISKPTADLSSQIPVYLQKLNDLVRDPEDAPATVSSVTVDVLCALAQGENPFKEFPWDTSKNIFCEILDFGIKHSPFLIKLIANLSGNDTGLDEKCVFKVAFLYSLLVSSANPRQNSSFLKLMTLMLKTSGCTG